MRLSGVEGLMNIVFLNISYIVKSEPDGRGGEKAQNARAEVKYNENRHGKTQQFSTQYQTGSSPSGLG